MGSGLLEGPEGGQGVIPGPRVFGRNDLTGEPRSSNTLVDPSLVPETEGVTSQPVTSVTSTIVIGNFLPTTTERGSDSTLGGEEEPKVPLWLHRGTPT